MAVADAIGWVTNVTFLVVALATVRIWLTQRQNPAARWLAAMFVLVTVIIFSTAWMDEDQRLPWLAERMLVGALVVFPYLLYRVADALAGRHDLWLRILTAMTVVVTLGGFFVPSFPEEGEPLTNGVMIWAIGLLSVWALASLAAGWRLFLAGRGAPTVIRRRTELVSVGSLLLMVVMFTSSLGTDGDGPANGWDIAVAVLTLGVAVTFLLGFTTPSPIRAWWRRREEQELHQATSDLMTADSVDAVVSIILVPFQRLLAADVVVLSGADDMTLGSAGDVDSFDAAPDWRCLDVEGGAGLSLRAVVSPAAPLLGQDERDLARRLLLIAGLATDRARRARALALTNKELEAANDELEAFVYTASHDLQNPLIAMLGYLDLLKHTHPFEPDSQPAMWLDRIETNGWFMSTLINDLLEFSRVGEGGEPREAINLGEMLRRVSEDASLRWPGLRVRVEGELPTIRGTATRVQQLLSNILSNAAQHAGEDVELTISSEQLLTGGIALSFHDNGPGIDPAHADRIFRVFERGNRADRERSGIGLAICRKIAESMGGDMWLEPSETGANFVVTFGRDRVVEDGAFGHGPRIRLVKDGDGDGIDHEDDAATVDPTVLA